MKQIFFLFLFTINCFAHSKHDHSKQKNLEHSPMLLAQINREYLHFVKPIFKKKCFDCHGELKRLPWYASLPIANQIIQQDIEEAKEHLDMRTDFPFLGHGDPIADLEEIKKSIESDSMPPLRYRLLHWHSLLNEREQKQTFRWIDSSLKKLYGKTLRTKAK